MNNRFHEHHAHTEYSNTHLVDCINKTSALINHAAQIGLHGISITDHECLSGHIKALNCAKEIHKTDPDFQVILGNEIYLCHDCGPYTADNGKTYYPIESGHFYHFILLAKDATGHKQLRQLSSRAWSRCYSSKGVERLPTFYSDIEEIVGKNPGHLVASTACLGGEFDKLTLAGDVKGAYEFVAWCQTQFGEENFFVELQPGLTDDQRLFNTRAIKFCKHFGLKWIITNDAHYLSKDKRVLHENYLKSHEEEREAGDFYESTYLKTPDEMIERMKDDLALEDIEAGFKNTLVIADMCKDAGDYGLFHSTIVPQRKLEPFVVNRSLDVNPELYPYIHKYYSSPEVQDLWLMKQLEIGMAEKNAPFDDLHLSRINYELEQLWGVSERLGQPMSAYYNLTQLIIQIMWNENGRFTPPGRPNNEAIVGVARGSVGGWYLGYLMSITQLDPIKWGTVPWRHLHASRPDCPDVDVDSPASRREAILERVKYVFGEDHCLNTITFRTEATKSAIKTACRGLDIDSDIATELSSLVPITRGKVWTLKECREGTEDNGHQPVKELINRISMYPSLMETIAEIEGLVSGRGIHASSVFIYNTPYIEHNSLMKSPQGLDCTAWDMGDSEACSGLKEDFLTVEGCDKIQICLELLLKDGLIEWQGSLKKTYDKYIHPDVLDYDSPDMWAEASDGKVYNLFQMDTPVGSEAIKKVCPQSLKELSLTNSVMRLMGNDVMVPIDHFVMMKKHPELRRKEMADAGLTEDEMAVIEDILSDNYLCSIEQEDLMRLCMDPRIAGFTMQEANKIRKAVAKKKPKLVAESKELFYKKGAELGARKEFLDYVWKYDVTPQLG